MIYDASSYKCQKCGTFITMKEFAEGLAGPSNEDRTKAEHVDCSKAFNK